MERHVHSSSKLQAEFKIRSMSFLDLFNLFVLKRCILKDPGWRRHGIKCFIRCCATFVLLKIVCREQESNLRHIVGVCDGWSCLSEKILSHFS